MLTRAKQWGNSLALRIPHALVEQLGLEPNTPLELTVSDGMLCVTPIRQTFPTLEELLDQIGSERVGEYDWGGPAGREVW